MHQENTINHKSKMEIDEIYCYLLKENPNCGHHKENVCSWTDSELFRREIQPRLEAIGLKILGDPDPKSNCFSYAYGFHTIFEETPCVQSGGFTKHLIRKRKLQETKNPSRGDYIVYKINEGEIDHIGIFEKDDQIRSRWGGGPILKHGTHQVPSKYGKGKFYYLVKTKIEKECKEYKKQVEVQSLEEAIIIKELEQKNQ